MSLTAKDVLESGRGLLVTDLPPPVEVDVDGASLAFDVPNFILNFTQRAP